MILPNGPSHKHTHGHGHTFTNPRKVCMCAQVFVCARTLEPTHISVTIFEPEQRIREHSLGAPKRKMVRSVCVCVCLMCVYKYTDLLALCLLGAQDCSTRLHCLIWRASEHTNRSDRATQHGHTWNEIIKKNQRAPAPAQRQFAAATSRQRRGVLLCAHIMFPLNRIIGNIDAQKKRRECHTIVSMIGDRTHLLDIMRAELHYTRAEHAIMAMIYALWANKNTCERNNNRTKTNTTTTAPGNRLACGRISADLLYTMDAPKSWLRLAYRRLAQRCNRPSSTWRWVANNEATVEQRNSDC